MTEEISDQEYTQGAILARLRAIEKAITLQHEDTVRVPTQIDREIKHLLDLVESRFEALALLRNEQFAGIRLQFEERDKRTEQLSLASSTAIAAALQAQKEAAGAQNESNAASIAKSEVAVTKQIDSILLRLSDMGAAFDAKLEDVKSRLDRSDGLMLQADRSRGESSSVWSVALSAAMAAAVILSLVISGVVFIVTHH
jgi:hypothetical protein